MDGIVNQMKKEKKQPNRALEQQNEPPEIEKGGSGEIVHSREEEGKHTKTQENAKREQARTTINKKLVVENWFNCKGVIETVAAKVGINPWTIHKWIREDDNFSKKLMDIDIDAKSVGEDILRGMAFLKKDVSALKFWLRANHEKYKLKVTSEIIGGGSQSAKELLDEFDKEIERYEKTKITKTTYTKSKEPSGKVGVPLQDKKQERRVSTIQTEQSSGILLEEEDEKKSDSKGDTKRNLKGNRRRPAPRLYSERY